MAPGSSAAAVSNPALVVMIIFLVGLFEARITPPQPADWGFKLTKDRAHP